jgi:hypothetical protein
MEKSLNMFFFFTWGNMRIYREERIKRGAHGYMWNIRVMIYHDGVHPTLTSTMFQYDGAPAMTWSSCPKISPTNGVMVPWKKLPRKKRFFQDVIDAKELDPPLWHQGIQILVRSFGCRNASSGDLGPAFRHWCVDHHKMAQPCGIIWNYLSG